jgi:uncharacterized protein YndB with AHSA1/START domain
MTTTAQPTDVSPVHKTITVKASQARAFQVFTEGFNTWWPRTHHIGKSPMKKAIIEGRVGGRCYSEQEDGSECDWGSILAWEPPSRVVMAWQITPAWGYEADVAKSSEVEIRFTPQADGTTRVDLEHRHFERLGPTGANMRMAVGSEMGWTGTLALFAAQAEKQP